MAKGLIVKSEWLNEIMENTINNELLQALAFLVLCALVWKFLLKPILYLLMKYLNKLNDSIQPLKCALGKHDKEYGMPFEAADTRITIVKCKNPDCSWEAQESKSIF